MFRNALRQSSRAVAASSATGRVASVSSPSSLPYLPGLTSSPIASLHLGFGLNPGRYVLSMVANGYLSCFYPPNPPGAVVDKICVLDSRGCFRSPQWRLQAGPFLRL